MAVNVVICQIVSKNALLNRKIQGNSISIIQGISSPFDLNSDDTTYRGIEIKFLPSTRFHKSKIFGKVLNILTFTASATLRLLFSKDKSPVFTHTTPPSVGIFVSLICKLKKRKFIYILLDIFFTLAFVYIRI